MPFRAKRGCNTAEKLREIRLSVSRQEFGPPSKRELGQRCLKPGLMLRISLQRFAQMTADAEET